MKKSVSQSLGELVEKFGGKLIGDPQTQLEGIAPIDEASDVHLSFLSNLKLKSTLATTQANAIILNEKDLPNLDIAGLRNVWVVPNAYVMFAKVAQHFYALNYPLPEPRIHPQAFVASSAQIAQDVDIAAHVSVDEGAIIAQGVRMGAGARIGKFAKIGANTVIGPNVTIYDYCEIGERCVIQAGAVIGADGFGFANEQGRWLKIPQTGRVIIKNDVEVGANTSIDRGALKDTVIENGVKLDNQIQIGHNCSIGENTAMAGCVGVAGSATIGKNCSFGGAAMVLGHLTIADNVHISSGSMVSRSINESGQYTGFYPLAKNAEWEKSAVIVRNIPQLRERIKQLEKELGALKKQNTSRD